MEQRLIECVPNFSEGRNLNTLAKIADAITSVAGVRLLHQDRGEAANRTVFTFVGAPELVCEAAFCAVKVAGENIDMSQHHGEHPRIGATDVLPLVPISGVTLAECATMAQSLSERIANELNIPVYCYEAAALRNDHRNLADCRSGEYEALAEKMISDAPDFGARPFDSQMARTGCSVVGARNFLIAVNFNLNTTSTDIAKAIARDVREKGSDGRPYATKGSKAIGWFIEEYGFAQVSMNIVDATIAPLALVFQNVCAAAALHGVKVTGTEIIGLIPEPILAQAGRDLAGNHALDNREAMQQAIKLLNLSQIQPFNIDQKVLKIS